MEVLTKKFFPKINWDSTISIIWDVEENLLQTAKVLFLKCMYVSK